MMFGRLHSCYFLWYYVVFECIIEDPKLTNSIHPTDQYVRLPGPIELCHLMLQARIRRGDFVVDATVGNGHDTAFLAELVGPDGLVFGFDIQAEAIDQTSQRLLEAGFENRVRLVQCGHENAVETIDDFHADRISAVVFNLGYLPGGDKKIVTTPRTTVQALQRFASIISAEGLITVVVYPGHEGGMEETKAVVEWASSLDSDKFLVTSYGFVNRPHHPPFSILLERRK